MTTGFTPSKNLRHYVEAGEVRTARSALLMELNDNTLDDSALRAAQAWAAGRLPDLYVAYTESTFARTMDKDDSHWNVDYFDTQVVYLKANFSEARFLHLVNVRQKLRNAGAERFQPEAAPTSRATTQQLQPAPASARPNRQTAASQSPSPQRPITRALLLAGGVAALALILILLRK